jgi:hypothetical protein
MDAKATGPKKSVFVYVDGFNLYHQVLETRGDLKWLCIKTLVSKFMLPNDAFVKAKFFTAKIDPKASAETEKQRRQKRYWDALAGSGVEVIPGRLEPRMRQCKAACGGTYFTMSEKMSDVSLALHIYRDFVKENPGIVCVITADLDVVPALRMIREENPRCDIRVFIPTFDDKVLFSRADDFKFVRLKRLEEEWVMKSQLSDPARDAGGVLIKRPDTWVKPISVQAS